MDSTVIVVLILIIVVGIVGGTLKITHTEVTLDTPGLLERWRRFWKQQ
ncbi:hypothetical protein [Planktothrix pseudagardhii]|uniref:Uncharacterized protein n=1 Tax=Planktothrix pseudagardhii TaxID=132604 RepID=A0A9W4G9G3_9CYAN|nr:hypothetical protein [Planktothrix pseudagardhii]CAD5981130.1 hypothetical protein NO713_04770 [Planktothrix pseudagardhii]